MEKLIMGIDVGTTGAKAMLLNTNGNMLSSGYREYGCLYPKSGWVEQNAETLMENTFAACKDAVKSAGVDPKQIAAVGFSVQRATFGLMDERNRLIDNTFYVWQDNRASTEIAYIQEKMPPDDMYNVCGHPITPTFSFEKLIWIMRHDRDLYERAKQLVFVSDYVLNRFGAEEILCEVTNAGCSGMLDIRRLKWADHLDTIYGIDINKLPRFVNPATVVGTVNKEAAEKSGLAEGTLLCTGSGDNQCGALGAGVTRAGLASMSLGTSGVLVVGSDEPVFEKNRGLMVNPSAVKGLYQIEGIQLGAASSYKWFRDTLATLEKTMAQETHTDAFVLMERYLKNSPVGANGLVFMPFLGGAGYPYWNTDAKGAFLGLDFGSSKSDMLRAVMEGITLESKDMFEHIKSIGVNIESVTMIGGASKSTTWRQILSDMFNVPIKTLKTSDSTNVGAAILAGVGCGLFRDTLEGAQKMVHFGDRVEPIQKHVKQYNELYSIYKKCYYALDQNRVFKGLADYKQNHADL